MFIFFNLLYEILLFQNCLLKFFPIAGIIDELCVIVLCILLIKYFFTRYKNKCLIYEEKCSIIFFGGFIFIGIISTLVNRIQPQSIAIIKDILAISKFIICYIATLILTRNLEKEKLLECIYSRTKKYIYIIFIFSIINIFINIGMAGDVRYGIRSFKFLFTHPTYLVSSIVLMMSVIIAKNEKSKSSKVVIIQAIIILILTFRSKAIMFVCAYFTMVLVVKYLKNIKIKYIVPIIIMTFFVSYQKVAEYLSWGLTAARPALYIIGFELAKKYFPLGSGFGTFASSLSGTYYSPIYYEYGISGVWGLTPEKYNYMADTFWPYIYGQFGFIGCLFFIICIVFIIRALILRYSYNKIKLLASLMIIMYIMIASIAEAIFTDVTGTFAFIFIATYLGENRNLYNNKFRKFIKIIY